MITTLAFVISGLGTLLLVILWSRIRAVNDELGLKKHRSATAGMADLLNYSAVVDDGVIVCKNGSFMAAWLYKGEDNASSTESYRESVSFRFNQAVSRLGTGWMLHADAARRASPTYMEGGVSHFPDPVSAAIDEERRRLFGSIGKMYEGYFVLVVTYFPPFLAQKKFVELMFDDDAVAPDKKSQTRALIDNFKRDIQNIESRVSSAVTPTRLLGVKTVTEDGKQITNDDFLRWLQFCVTGLNHPVRLPDNPVYLDALIGGQEL